MTGKDTPMPAWLEDAWLNRYLDRQLSAEEVEWFEVYALDKPDLLARIESDLDLRDALDAAAADGALTALPVAVSADARRGTARARRPRSSAVWVARAASLAAAAGLGWIAASLSPHSGPGPLGGSSAIVADPTRVVFDTLRGESQSPLVFNAGSSSPLLLIEVGVPPDAVDVQLLRPSQAPLRLSVSSEGFVSFLLPRSEAGALEMELRYTTAGTPVRRPLVLPSP